MSHTGPFVIIDAAILEQSRPSHTYSPSTSGTAGSACSAPHRINPSGAPNWCVSAA